MFFLISAVFPKDGVFFYPTTASLPEAVFRCSNFNLPNFSPSYYKKDYLCTRKEESEMLELLGTILLVYIACKIAGKAPWIGGGNSLTD